MRIRAYILFAKATVHVAMQKRLLAVEIFKVQFDYSRIVEVGRKVLRSGGPHSAHAKDSISNFWWEAINTLRTPWYVVRKSARTRKGARVRAIECEQ